MERERTPTPPPGIHENVPHEDYLAWDAWSNSDIKAAMRSLSYCRWKRTAQSEEKAAYTKGSLFHTLTLEPPEEADRRFVIKPPEYHHPDDAAGKMRKWNGNAAACKSWLAANADKIITDEKTLADTRAMAERVHEHPILGPIVAGCYREVSVVAQDPQTGIMLKGRFDFFKATEDRMIVGDLKSTSGSAGFSPFVSEASKYRYMLQAAFYLDLAVAAGMKPTDAVAEFLFITVETDGLKDLSSFQVYPNAGGLSGDFYQCGRNTYLALLQEIAYAMKHDEWPGYQEEPYEIELAGWAQQMFENEGSILGARR